MIQIWKLRRVANRGLKSITNLNTTTLDNHFMCCRDRLPSVARIASHSSFNKGRQRVVSSFKNARHQTGFAITSEGGQHYNGKMTEFVVLSCIVAATGGLIFGNDIGISSLFIYLNCICISLCSSARNFIDWLNSPISSCRSILSRPSMILD